MGFLDHSTNNIIVDAVLTDIGRQKLANGTFSIAKFALGDDEVDYTLITKFGRTIGKEKIEKNTPVFEAQTNADLALKNKLLTCSNPYLVKLPYLTATISPASGQAARSGAITITLRQGPDDLFASPSTTGASDVRDTVWDIEYDSRFLTLTGGGTSTVGSNNIAHARVTTSATVTDSVWNGAELVANFNVNAFSNSYFSYYASDSSNSIIRTYVEFAGAYSGKRFTQEIQITYSS